MAIINLTPDSFWAGSRNTELTVLGSVERAVREGAEIIDIGAQSTRPGYTQVPPEEELSRFLQPLIGIKKHFDIPVSVDTYFPLCARAALENGADMINDVWGLSRDREMADIIAGHNAAVCIMHNAHGTLSGDIWEPVNAFLAGSVKRAIDAGISPDKICLDGGIGFAKTREQNLQLLEKYYRLAVHGYPLLLGTSRKSLFGGNVEDRLPQTLESTKLAVRQGIMFVRVHDVKENVRAIREAYCE